ncbi:hypothetical protein HJC23_003936 [Cyclotella cryptica]|uniref:Battenin n=1 Tax=Cyclotella cryptica TaxID=29204 RepID=A0ABD3PUA5_9STRA
MELFGWSFSSVVFSVVLFAVAYYTIFYYGLCKLEEQELDASIQTNAEGDALDQQNIPPIHMLESSLLVHTRYNDFDETKNNVEMVGRLEKNSSPSILFRGVQASVGCVCVEVTWKLVQGASLSVLWLMPMLQVANLMFFLLNLIHHFWYNYSLILSCFFAGLLGGGVYVQGYSRLNLDVPRALCEFAIGSAGTADSLGIFVADIASLIIQMSCFTPCNVVYSKQDIIRIVLSCRTLLQSCIYDQNGIEGVAVTCPTT